MIKVHVKKQSNYPVSTPKLKEKVESVVSGGGVVSDADVWISLVGKKAMYKIAEKFLGEKNKLHTVLAFCDNEVEGKFVYPDETIHLGEVVVCFPLVRQKAKEENKRIYDKVEELVEHGTQHLIGIHHD
jgi:rRNA maturation RNase YbeY